MHLYTNSDMAVLKTTGLHELRASRETSAIGHWCTRAWCADSLCNGTKCLEGLTNGFHFNCESWMNTVMSRNETAELDHCSSFNSQIPLQCDLTKSKNKRNRLSSETTQMMSSLYLIHALTPYSSKMHGSKTCCSTTSWRSFRQGNNATPSSALVF